MRVKSGCLLDISVGTATEYSEERVGSLMFLPAFWTTSKSNLNIRSRRRASLRELSGSFKIHSIES